MKTVALLSMLPFALYGIWRALMALQYQAARYKARRVESSRRYDPVFGYHLDGGEPLFLVDPANSRTLFFLEGFRTQSPAGMYRKRFEELFARGTNVVVPVYGLQSSSFELRNRDWRLEEDLRLVRQTYDAYVASLPAGHRVVLCSQSFGALPALAVAASAARRPDALVFLSPHNEGLDFKVSGPVVRWLARQSSWLRFVLRYSMASPAPGRASVWDIADRELNQIGRASCRERV